MPKKERIKGKRFYFLGIGGASMSALAKYILCEGGEVFGYDAQLSARTEELARAGVEIYTSAAISETEKAVINSAENIVCTSAISRGNRAKKSYSAANF